MGSTITTHQQKHLPSGFVRTGRQSCIPYTPIDFFAINRSANTFADHIESHFKELADILLTYESFEVVKDETNRTLDLLRNLPENREYFSLRIGAVTSFLPRNQPLYALTCFVVVPALMASDVHFRIPHSMRLFFTKLLNALRIDEFFPNIVVSRKERLDFLRERSAIRMDPRTSESMPVTDAVIFTGTSIHAERLRLVFDRRTLFIANGAGHNPVVVAENADIRKAVEGSLILQLYNQGQDCAAPNAILVHGRSFRAFMQLLYEELSKVRVGHYCDRSCRVGPISEPDDLVRIQALLVENHQWIDPRTPGVIRARDAIVEPTIICRPLKEGGNFTEVFAPIIIVQQYEDDSELSLYFEDSRYARNAMYISLFGTSQYIQHLIGLHVAGKVLHDHSSLLYNTHLHAPGVERGTQPYGGYGFAASSISLHGKITCKPTLPQRDIYEQVVRPILVSGKLEERRNNLCRMTETQERDVCKLMGLMKTMNIDEKIRISHSGLIYVDSFDITSEGGRYRKLLPARTFSLLGSPNVAYIATMEPNHLHKVRLLHGFLSRHQNARPDEFAHFLYSIAKNPCATDQESRLEQLSFFHDVYQLLFARDSGPRLASFLIDVDRQHVLTLLNV